LILSDILILIPIRYGTLAYLLHTIIIVSII